MDEQIVEKLTDKEFSKKVIGLKTKKEVKKAFEDEGIAISDKQLNELGKSIRTVVKKLSELSPKELEEVSGGGFFFPTTWADVMNNAVTQPGFVPIIVGGLMSMGSEGFKSFLHRHDPPPTQPVISDKAVSTAVVAAAVLSSGYVITQLAKSGWFNAKSVSKHTKTANKSV